jgi:hypothetical protein
VRADLADGYLAAGRVDDAIAVLAAAVGEDAEASQRLARLYERTGRHRDLALLLATSALPTERAPRLALLRRRASAWRVANDRKAALAALRDVLAEAPSDPEALGEIERDCRLRGDVSELRARLTAAAADATAPVAQRSRWLRETAQLTEHAGEVDAAVALWLRAAEAAESADAAGEAQEAREAVVRLLAHEERWDELLAHLARQAQGAGRAELRRAWWLRWVEVHRERRDDPSREAAVLAGLVADDPTDDRAALLLIDAHRRAGQAAAAAAAYRELIARSPPEHRAARWGQLAGHLEQHGDLTGALEAWHHARTADPSQALAWAAEERILEATGESEALLEVLTAHANHPVAAGRRAGELFQRAAWLARDLARADEAARLAERAIKFDLDDPGLVALAEHLGVHALEDVPTSLLEAALEGDSVVHDTGEYPAAHLDDLDAPGAVTGEHTPAEGTHFEGLISAHEFDESVEDTVTRARRSELSMVPEADPGDLLGLEEASTRELPAFAETLSGRPAAATSTDDATSAGDEVAAMDEPADGSSDDFVEVVAVTGEHPVASRMDDGPRTAETALPDVAERAPDAALSSTTDRPAAAEAERTRDGAPPEWAGRDPSSSTDPLEDEVIPIDDEASALAEPEPAPLPRASLPPLAPSVPPPPADDLPSIIVDDALLDVAVVSAPPPEAPPLAPAQPPLTARIAPPAPPVLPPLAASAFVASAASAPPRASWTPPLAPPPPPPLAPLPPSAFAPAAPVALPPLAPPPGSPWSPPAALPPLSAQGFASSSAPGLAAPSPPSSAPAPGYDGGDPFAASGDPFAAMPAPLAAFSAAPAVAFSAGPPLVGGDPFAGVTAPAPSPVASMKPPAPLPPPVAPVAPPPSNFQKTMAALFEQALVAQRGPG